MSRSRPTSVYTRPASLGGQGAIMSPTRSRSNVMHAVGTAYFASPRERVAAAQHIERMARLNEKQQESQPAAGPRRAKRPSTSVNYRHISPESRLFLHTVLLKLLAARKHAQTTAVIVAFFRFKTAAATGRIQEKYDALAQELTDGGHPEAGTVDAKQGELRGLGPDTMDGQLGYRFKIMII